jgi:hypothetical protein
MIVTGLKIDELVRWRATERSNPDWVDTKLNARYSVEATNSLFTCATQNGARMPHFSLSLRYGGVNSLAAAFFIGFVPVLNTVFVLCLLYCRTKDKKERET